LTAVSVRPPTPTFTPTATRSARFDAGRRRSAGHFDGAPGQSPPPARRTPGPVGWSGRRLISGAVHDQVVRHGPPLCSGAIGGDVVCRHFPW